MILKTTRGLAAGLSFAALLASCTNDKQSDEIVTEEQLAAPAESSAIKGQYIIVFKADVAKQTIGDPSDYMKAQEAMKAMTKKMFQESGVKDAEVISTFSKTIKGAAIKVSANQISRLQSRDDVDYIEEDKVVIFAPPCGTPNGVPCSEDPGDGGASTSQETPYGITRVNGVSSYSGSGVAWVIDTGIDLDHEDLHVDAARGFNAFTSGRDGKSLDDGNGHGTHVAGTIGALNNNVGVIGVAPGATVIPVKVLDSRGSGSYSGVIAGVDYVAANGANGDVANMSLGGPVSQALDDAVLAASQQGIKFVLAAGNESDDANSHSPARVNGSNIYTISAMDSNDSWAYFSNYGNPPVDYAAPGVGIKSTWKSGGYNTISGTSMASPHAAGVLLLGSASTDGTVSGDPDGNSDAIIVH
ncbi:S8 family peptidase [Zunongwangia pacifica]|uniref:S8 family peptidase n=1 Tax=Zunongwangia pacifica TaxID=2911062 RepID=A0A9X1ZRP4_9FLAO|nr:S8 family peptidase [Zunongwangia pacifica]MCL6219807.1 S8 family peptidase [Zunongwangia pacifica]